MRKYIQKAKNLFSKKRVILKQELLFRKALREAGFKNLRDIKIDHINGINIYNNTSYGIIYPESFKKEIEKMPCQKVYNFYFNGFMHKEGGRLELLSPYTNLINSHIINSSEGRDTSKKDQFNIEYFTELSKAKFGLCPHQMDWTGPLETMWTYRFIECCLVKAIPILFKKAPLGEKFTTGFKFYWDEDITVANQIIIPKYHLEWAEQNYKLALERFFINN